MLSRLSERRIRPAAVWRWVLWSPTRFTLTVAVVVVLVAVFVLGAS